MTRSDIEHQAKALMDAFLAELQSVTDEQQFGLQRSEHEMRDPQWEQPNERFQKAFFANAPSVKDNLLQMERKQW